MYIVEAYDGDELVSQNTFEDYSDAYEFGLALENGGSLDVYLYNDEEEEIPDEPDDLECGFDPYMGCYSYDC